jgi:hypothetical protein
MTTKLSLVASGLLAALLVAAGPQKPAEKHEHRDAAKVSALVQFKRLAGEWKGTSNMHDEKPAEVKASYRVTSGGSAVVETVFAGSDHEMVTVYHLDGDDLVLTHYCMLGNQPRMKAERGSDPKKSVFKFAGGTNIKPDSDLHMHEAVFEFIDDDHFTSSWTLYRDGKPATVAKIDLRRVKK